MRKYYFLFLLFLLAPAFAEVTECTGNSSCPSDTALRNLTLVTGVQGSTVLYCSADVDCVDTGYFKCFSDIDSVSSSPYTGWCNSTSIVKCYINGTAYNNSYYYCTTTASYQQCSSGAWGAATACASNNTCTAGMSSPCATSPATTSPSSGGTTPANTTPTPTPTQTLSMAISSAIADFDMTQGESAIKTLIAKNNGNKSLTDVKAAVSGAGDVTTSVSPEKFANMTVGSTATFLINFSAGANASVKSYTVTTEVSSSEAKASATFTLRILPSNATVSSTILPLYDSLSELMAKLELNVTELEKKGVNTSSMKQLISDIRDKLNQTSGNIEKKDYFAASQLLDSAKSLIADLQASILQAKSPGFDFIPIIIIVVIIAVVGVLAYLLWPSSEEGFNAKKGWKHGGEDSIADRILEKIKRKKNEYGTG